MRNSKLNKIGKAVLIGTAFLGLTLSACKKNKGGEEEVEFSKKELMENWADNWITPAYSDVDQKVGSLQTSYQTFLTSESTSDFEAVKNAWKEAFLSFQRIKLIDFGPAMNVGYQGALGTFPVDTAQIESNISAGTYDLNTFSNIGAVGFAALDYLLFRSNAQADLLSSNVRKQYVSDVISKMKSETNSVAQNWAAYRETFVSGTGTSSTDDFSELINAFCKDFELIKHGKVGIPIGKQSLGIPRPEYLEARYAKFGKESIVKNLEALRDLYMGKSLTGTDGKGLDDYLIALDKGDLNTTIQTRFSTLISQATNWNSDIENLMNSDVNQLDVFYNYITSSVVYLKTDMTSSLGILITYQDNDGD